MASHESRPFGQVIGDRIKARRAQLDITVAQLATRAGLDASNVRLIEKGEGNPRVKSLLQIAVALELDVTELVAGLGRESLGEAIVFTEADYRAELERRRAAG